MVRLIILFLIVSFSSIAAEEDSLLHASFDVTRELFKEINAEFIKQYNKKIKISQSHGGSGKQTSAVIHGLPADLVSLALPYHMDLLVGKGLVANNWRNLFPNNSSPMNTHIVFIVHKNNPKNIRDWNDLIKDNIKVITANPKTSGGALWNYVAAWIYTKKNSINSIEFIHKLYNNAPILDSTARNSAITFLKRRIGDVLITWKSEAEYIISKLDANYEIIEPSVTVKIEIPIAAILNRNNITLANDYINFLFSKKGQSIITKNYYQAINNESTSKNIVNAEDYIIWSDFKKEHFGENGIFDQIYK
jgi:sulfate transport system substrate-binding protein